MIKVNLTSKATVTVTEVGCDVYKKRWRKIGVEPPQKLKPGDQYTDQLWCIMEMFGAELANGFTNPIGVEIEIDA